jgi:hypothetical protein
MDKPATKHTTFRLDVELVRWAKRYALDHDTSVTAIIEQHLRTLRSKEGRK